MHSKIKRILSTLLVASILAGTISTNSYAVDMNTESNIEIENETVQDTNQIIVQNNKTDEKTNKETDSTDMNINSESQVDPTLSTQINENETDNDIENDISIQDENGNDIKYTLKNVDNQEELISKIDFSKTAGNLIWFQDIQLNDKNSGTMNISIPIEEDTTDKIAYVIHFKNGTEPEYIESKLEDKCVKFSLDSFSPVAIYLAENLYHYNQDDFDSISKWFDKYTPNGDSDLLNYDDDWWNSLFNYEYDYMKTAKEFAVTLPNNIYMDQSIDECISIVENGTPCNEFFDGTIFEKISLNDLNTIQNYGYTLNEITNLYYAILENDETNTIYQKYINESYNSKEEQKQIENIIDIVMNLYTDNILNQMYGINLLDENGNVAESIVKPSLVSTGYSGSAHPDPIYRITLGGKTAFCGSQGKHCRSYFVYKAGEGQYKQASGPIGYIVKNFTSSSQAATAQVAIWSIQKYGKNTKNLRTFIIQCFNDNYKDGKISADMLRGIVMTVEGWIGQAYSNPCTYYIYSSDSASSQVLFTADKVKGSAVSKPDIPDKDSESVVIPNIDNYYIEKKATTNYKVEVTKESVITNELLEGIKFHVVESKASGKALDYDIIKGTLSEYGNDYPNATTSTFGQTTTELDPVPYMDDDVRPSGGQHETTLITDKNGYATTTFTHKHTFREFYSICKDGNNNEIDYDSYTALLDSAVEIASNTDEDTLQATYMGTTTEMSPDQVLAICNAQKIVYTQPQDVAEATVEDLYDQYCARTYTYTVTELDNYTRNSSSDSNDKTLDEITLPKEGYRKDVKDVTTMNTYSKVVKNGGTMTTGGTNDSDDNTKEKNVTNEPWYNQIFINKSDLESSDQILYDTEFEIYEYYNSKTTLSGAERTIKSQDVLNQALGEYNSQVDLATITGAKLTVLNPGGKVVTEKTVNVANNDSISFTPTDVGKYTVSLEIAVDDESSLESTSTTTASVDHLEELGTCTCPDDSCLGDECEVCKIDDSYCKSKQYDENCTCTDVCDPTTCTVCELDNTLCKTKIKEYTVSELFENKFTYVNAIDQGNNKFETEDDTTFEYELDEDTGIYTITVTKPDGTQQTYTTEDDNVSFDVTDYFDSKEVHFGYMEVVDSGIKVFSYTDDAGTKHYTGKDDTHTYVKIDYDEDVGTMTLYYYPSENYKLKDGYFKFDTEVEITATDLTVRNVNNNVNTDLNDYTTWGQDNYEIVRVTSEIARQMGWSDTTIGMYTVHRISPLDKYTGTYFTNTKDETTKQEFGYYEYGTLYYTQNNLGHYAIIEKTAPSDSNRSGYLGNYSDRNYTNLSDESAKKNNNGAPYATDDSISTVKMVHYLQLCVDTNQYATYMLTDGYKEYDAEKYVNYVETLNDPGQTATEDGYDADYYNQSGLTKTIGLERKTLDGDAKEDVLNKKWDNDFNTYLFQKSGIVVNRNSQKKDTFFALKEIKDKIMNFVGTTINIDSYDNNESAESEITYNGTYTDTELNYNSYTEEAEKLNARHGFNDREFLQVGLVNYDNGTNEKVARFENTEADVNKETGYAFIDERTYGFIRFTKYDVEAERYITGDLNENYEAGTDHDDADLDGAIYSLYVSENNTFNVDYYEGAYKGRLFWAQPINTGGFRIIYSASTDVTKFEDTGDNEFKDYPHAYYSAKDKKLYLDYASTTETGIEVEKHTAHYKGIQHPDGLYGGPKHNGFFAVLEEQQVFIDADDNNENATGNAKKNDGYSDTWTVQDVTLENGAKVASATIKNGELQFDGLYLGNYYIVEEIRDSIYIYSTNNDDEETSEIKWLSFAPGYLAETDNDGNPVKHNYSFPYQAGATTTTTYTAEQDYVTKDTVQYSDQQVVKGAGFQIKKLQTNGESASSNNNQGVDLEGAGFTVYLISELSLIQNGTIQPAFNEDEGNMLVHNNNLVALFDESGNLSGYQFTRDYINEHNPFTAKYGTDYNESEVNKLVFVAGHGYYFMKDILDAYKDKYYSNESLKWDFTNEDQAIARIYENDTRNIQKINEGYDYVNNHLNANSPCQWYGLNGISEGWVATGVKNEYKLAELFTNHYGHIKSPELAWGAYLVVETTTPDNLFTVDPLFVTITDTSATANRSKKTTLTDTTFVAQLILAKRDAQSGQTVVQSGISYRIWDYTNNKYVEKYIKGVNGGFSVIKQSIFTTDESGRVNAISSLEIGKYRIEELQAPHGYRNTYWDKGNGTNGEVLGGLGEDANRATDDNKLKDYYGTVDFEVTTDRLYKASGETGSDNLDYIYIGETYYNDEVLGKINILKTGEVLVGYTNTDNIEYADEYTDVNDAKYNALKASAKDRAIFKQVKDHYDLGTDKTETRTIETELTDVKITPVSHLVIDRNGTRIAAVYTDTDGTKLTMNGGTVYNTGIYQEIKGNDPEKTFYPLATTITEVPNTYCYRADGKLVFVHQTTRTNELGITETYWANDKNEEITDESIINSIQTYAYITTKDNEKVYGLKNEFVKFGEADGYIMIEYNLSMDTYEEAELRKVNNYSIYAVKGDINNTSYLVEKQADGTLMTTDYGVITESTKAGTYTLTYTEAIYNPDIDYDYTITLNDGSTLNARLVTYGIYLTKDNQVIRSSAKGFTITDKDGNTTTHANGTIKLTNENTGETFDFVYEERPLADATFQITAAEDIQTQDGNGNYWFKKGDIVATVTTGNDGEIVSFTPNYKTASNNGGGNYDYTYYYGKGENDDYTSLTGTKSYNSDEFATTGSIHNYWIKGNNNDATRMSQLDQDIYEIPKFTDETIYPNTFYKDADMTFIRHIYHSTTEKNPVASNYVTRLEDEGKLTTSSSGILTKTDNGYRLTYETVKNYAGAKLSKMVNGFGTLTLSDGNVIEVKEGTNYFVITESSKTPWTKGDIVEKTATGYKITHTDAYEAGKDNGSNLSIAKDMGYTYTETYGNATIIDNGNDTWTLVDNNGNTIVKMTGNPIMTEEGAFVNKTATGYEVSYTKYQDIDGTNKYFEDLSIDKATLTVKDDTYKLRWDDNNKQYVSTNGATVKVSDDFNSVAVTTDGQTQTYNAYDLVIDYSLHYGEKQNVVKVENDGTLGTVSIYLPLGKYNVQEIKTPYGFLINDKVQTVELNAVDQVKEVVFNDGTNGSAGYESANHTDGAMEIFLSKGLQWFRGGMNTVGEKLNTMFNVNFFTWGTYGDAEKSYFKDKEGFLNFYDLRVKAWSQEKVPDKPDNDKNITIKTTATDANTNTQMSIAKDEITIIDKVSYKNLTVGKEYTVKGTLMDKATGKEFIDADGNKVTAEKKFTPTTENGSVALTFTFAGHYKDGSSTVVFEKLLDATGKVIASHEDIDDKDQTVDIVGEKPEIRTKAKDSEREDNTAYADDVVTIIDTVSYVNLTKGETYVVKGTLMDKETGKELTDTKGNKITSEKTFVASSETGSVNMKFTFDASDLDGKSTVVFEKLLSANGEVVTTHEDLNDNGQTITFDKEKDDRKPDSDENQWKLGVGIYKADKNSKASLKGAKFALYTKNDIYNADGKLLVGANTMLATATTDESGFANFAVDIALMSKYLDPKASDAKLIYDKSVQYSYDNLTKVSDTEYILSVYGTSDITLTKDGDIYRTEDGHELTIDTNKKTVSYMIEQSIDGNTAINTGDYYIQEITPPDGYLINDTIYDVSFQYDDEYTMYIPVYAKHQNIPTEVTLTKKDITGAEEIPGAKISVYKINDVNNVNVDGVISHEDSNLTLIDSWTSEASPNEAHKVTGLLLSNREWPRLNNQMVRDNIYVFREEIPASGYTTANDIEFKIYQKSVDDKWLDADGNEYGWEVVVKYTTCDQDYISGTLVAPIENADDWILRGETENTWDYTKELDCITVAKWMLVNDNLVVFFSKDATKETVDKVLREEDFEDYEFNTVYYEFGGDKFDVDFYSDLVVNERPETSKLTYTSTWCTLDDIHTFMYDDTTKVKISKQDIVKGTDIDGAHLLVTDAEKGTVIDEWTTGDDGYDENGKPLPHYIKGKLKVNHKYVLTETLAPTKDGYVKSNSIIFTVEDTGEIQKVVMQDDFTKLEISKKDFVTGEEIDGAKLEVWKLDENGEKETLIETWITGQDGYDADGKPNKHYIDYLEPGKYSLVETMAPEGYLISEDVEFEITETGILQKVEMFDMTNVLKVYKYKTNTTEFVPNATINIYKIPDEYVDFLEQDTNYDVSGGIEQNVKDENKQENKDEITQQTSKGSDLNDYLTTLTAKNHKHAKNYTSDFKFEYKMSKDDLVNADYKFVQTLPELVKLDDTVLDKTFTALDGIDTAFTYEFSKTEDGLYQITVEINKDYTKDADDISFYIETEVIIDNKAVKGNGDIEIPFTNNKLIIEKELIKEIDSQLNAEITTIPLSDKDLVKTIITENKATTVVGLEPGWYVAMETKAPDGYTLDSTPHVFRYINMIGEQTITIYNTEKPNPKPDKKKHHHSTPEEPTPTPTPSIGKLTLRIDNEELWNNIRTEDNGDIGSSIQFEIDNKQNNTLPLKEIGIGLVAIALVGGITFIIKRKEEDNEE